MKKIIQITLHESGEKVYIGVTGHYVSNRSNAFVFGSPKQANEYVKNSRFFRAWGKDKPKVINK